MSCFAVPASIDVRLSSGNVAMQEGRDVTITCSVFGIPQPEVTWYRRARTSQLTDAEEEQCEMTTDTGKLETVKTSSALAEKSRVAQKSRHYIFVLIVFAKY